MLSFRTWLEEFAGFGYNPKLVIVLGGPGSGKTFVAMKFREHKFRVALLDQYFEAIRRKATGGGKVMANLLDPQQKQQHVWAATRNDRRMDWYISNGYPFVTEKTGQNYGTIASLKTMAEAAGYDVYAVYVDVDPELAVKRNLSRPDRSLSPEEVRKTHLKVREKMMPGPMGAGLPGLFRDNFYTVPGDGSPQSNAVVEQTINAIVSKPLKNAKKGA